MRVEYKSVFRCKKRMKWAHPRTHEMTTHNTLVFNRTESVTGPLFGGPVRGKHNRECAATCAKLQTRSQCVHTHQRVHINVTEQQSTLNLQRTFMNGKRQKANRRGREAPQSCRGKVESEEKAGHKKVKAKE